MLRKEITTHTGVAFTWNILPDTRRPQNAAVLYYHVQRRFHDLHPFYSHFLHFPITIILPFVFSPSKAECNARLVKKKSEKWRSVITERKERQVLTSEHSADEHEEESERRQGDLAVRCYHYAGHHETAFDLLHPQSWYGGRALQFRTQAAAQHSLFSRHAASPVTMWVSIMTHLRSETSRENCTNGRPQFPFQMKDRFTD